MLLGVLAQIEAGALFLEDATDAVKVDIQQAHVADGFVAGTLVPGGYSM